MRKPRFTDGSQYILLAIALGALAIVIWRLTDVFVIAFGGVVVANLLQALADPLKRFRRLTAALRLTIAILSLAAALGLLGWLFGHQVADQAGELQRLLPEQARRVNAWLQQFEFGRTWITSLRNLANDSKTLHGLGSAAATVLGGTLEAILIGFLGVYFAFDPDLYLNGAVRLLPPARRPEFRRALLQAGAALRKWLLAQLVAMLVVGILAGLGLALIGVPLALVLGALAALLEFIPIVGPIIFGVPAVLVAFSQGPRVAVYALLLYTAIQQLESNLIVPLLQRWAVRMPPVVGLLAVLAAGILLGPTGIIFAAPAAVVAVELVKCLYIENTLEARPAPAPGSQS